MELISPGKVSRSELAQARSKSHRMMRERTKDSRKVEKFQKNDRVLLQDEKMGKFSHRATVVDPRDRRSDDPRSYYIKKDISGEILLRNRRHFKKLPANASETADTHPAHPRSYYIKMDISGEILLRNRRHFKKLPANASETADTHPAPQSEATVEPRTCSEHARTDRESLQADTTLEGPQHVQRLTAGHGELPESREQHVHHRPGVLTAQGWEQYRPADAIASLQCRSRRGTKWSD